MRTSTSARRCVRPRRATIVRVALAAAFAAALGADLAGTHHSRFVHVLIGVCCRTCAGVTEAGVTAVLERAVPISEEKPLNREEQAGADGFSFVAIGASAGG
jgi:hypothetical protein